MMIEELLKQATLSDAGVTLSFDAWDEVHGRLVAKAIPASAKERFTLVANLILEGFEDAFCVVAPNGNAECHKAIMAVLEYYFAAPDAEAVPRAHRDENEACADLAEHHFSAENGEHLVWAARSISRAIRARMEGR